MGSRVAGPIKLDDQPIRELQERILKHLFKGEGKLSDPRSLGAAWKDIRELRETPEAWDKPMRELKGLRTTLVPGENFETTSVKGDPVSVFVTLGWKPSRGGPRVFVTGGNVKASHESLRSKGKPFKLTISLNSKVSANALIRGQRRLAKELLSVLRHEVTHLRDLLSYHADTDDERVYVNRPEEVRAFMRQIVDEVLEVMERDAKDSEGWIDTTWDSTERYLDKSPTWNRVKRLLSSQSRRQILKAVGQAVVRVKPDLRKRYYVPMTEVASEEALASKVARRFLTSLKG